MTIPAIPRNSSTESRYLLVFPGEKGTSGMANRALLVMDVRQTSWTSRAAAPDISRVCAERWTAPERQASP